MEGVEGLSLSPLPSLPSSLPCCPALVVARAGFVRAVVEVGLVGVVAVVALEVHGCHGILLEGADVVPLARVLVQLLGDGLAGGAEGEAGEHAVGVCLCDCASDPVLVLPWWNTLASALFPEVPMVIEPLVARLGGTCVYRALM